MTTNIRIDGQGCIVRSSRKLGLHSEYWVPTVINPSGRMYYYNEDALYFVRFAPSEQKVYIFYNIDTKQREVSVHNPNGINGLPNAFN